VQKIFVFVTKIFREDTPLEVCNVYCMKPEVHSLTHTNKTARYKNPEVKMPFRNIKHFILRTMQYTQIQSSGKV